MVLFAEYVEEVLDDQCVHVALEDSVEDQWDSVVVVDADDVLEVED